MKQSIPERALNWLVAAYRRRQSIRHLSSLSDHYLRDIGIERDEIRDAVYGRVSPRDMLVRNNGAQRQAFYSSRAPAAARANQGAMPVCPVK